MDVQIDRNLVTELTRDLIRIPTVNPPGNERPAAEYLAKRMQELGIEAEVQVIEDTRANVIGRVRGSGSGHLVLTGHIDVVPPGAQAWEHGPFDADVVDGRIYGRGSTDMKGGVAAMVTAAAALVKAGFQPKADLILAITCGEEAGMLGAKAVVDRGLLEGSAYLVVGEPTGLDVYIGEKGVLWVFVRAYGRTAHGSTPELGANAVSAIARIIPALEEYPFPYEGSALLGKPSISVNVITGGNKTNVVPDFCEIAIDLRTLPSQDHDDLVRRIRELAERVAHEYDPNVRIEIAVDQSKTSLETDRADSLVDTVIEAVERVRGGTPYVGGVTFGTDAAYLGPGFNIPMVICGPGGLDMLHQPNEWVVIDQLEQGAQIYAETAQILLG